MRILVVEDEPRIADDVRSALTGAGYVVDHATDGEDAWFRGDTEAYDLVILDLGLLDHGRPFRAAALARCRAAYAGA